MAKNRLQLDFSLEYMTERAEFVNKYVEEEQFKNKPLTEIELETIANYILWGKGPDGKNAVQRKEIEIDTKYSTWKKDKNIESLEELMENPAFDENTISKVGTFSPTRVKREVFDRNKALKEAPDYLIPDFIALFRQIDEVDLIINYYEILCGKRTKPPRDELINRFNDNEKEELQNRAATLNQRNYLKLRHHLVDLRTSQFALRDSYKFSIQKETKVHLKYEAAPIALGEDVPVFPLGLNDDSSLAKNIFLFEKDLKDITFSEQTLKNISDFYWEQEQLAKNKKEMYFDFAELEHVYQLVLSYEDLQVIAEENESIKYLLNTLNFYLNLAQLNEMHREILNLKISKEKNENIANYINEKYSKSYTINYISTIFRQKIIKEINNAALFHKEIIENIFYPENFRTCTCCGEFLLKSPFNFVRKSRSADGFTGRCKRCDRLVREKKK